MIVCPATALSTTVAQAPHERPQVRGLVGVDGRGDAHHDRICVSQRGGLGRELQRVRRQMTAQPLPVPVQQVDPTGLDVGQPGFAHVAAGDVRSVVGQRQRRGQSHVAEADDGDLGHALISAPTIHTGRPPLIAKTVQRALPSMPGTN